MSVVRSEMTPVATLDCSTKVRISGTSSPSSLAAPDGNRRSATTPTNGDHERRDRLGDHDRDERLGHAHGRCYDDREEAKRGRSGLVHARRS